MTARMALASVLVVSLGSSVWGLALTGPAAGEAALMPVSHRSEDPAPAGRAPTKLTFMGWNIRGLGQNQTWDAARESSHALSSTVDSWFAGSIPQPTGWRKPGTEAWTWSRETF